MLGFNKLLTPYFEIKKCTRCSDQDFVLGVEEKREMSSTSEFD